MDLQPARTRHQVAADSPPESAVFRRDSRVSACRAVTLTDHLTAPAQAERLVSTSYRSLNRHRVDRVVVGADSFRYPYEPPPEASVERRSGLNAARTCRRPPFLPTSAHFCSTVRDVLSRRTSATTENDPVSPRKRTSTVASPPKTLPAFRRIAPFTALGRYRDDPARGVISSKRLENVTWAKR